MVKNEMPLLSTVVLISAWMILASFWVRIILISAKIPFLSTVVTLSVAGYTSFSEGSHDTGTSLSGAAFLTCLQDSWWIVMPRPRVINPTTSSPGSGWQHLAKWSSISLTPSTLIPRPSLGRRKRSTTLLTRPCDLFSLIPNLGLSRPTICLAETLPKPICAARSSTE